MDDIFDGTDGPALPVVDASISRSVVSVSSERDYHHHPLDRAVINGLSE